MPNLQVGFTIRAFLPASPALSTLELLTGRVVPVPFDESTVVEGTVRPTTASSPDADVRGNLATGLDKAEIQIKTSKSKMKVLDCNQLATYLLLVACEELLHFLTIERVPFGCPTWVSALGVGLCSPSLFSPAASSSAQPKLDICFIYAKFQEEILGFG